MKKGNATVFLLGAAAVGIGYWLYSRKQAQDPSTGLSYPQNYNPQQPSQAYPWQATVPPRVDNANQPWYAGSRQAMSGPAESGLNNFATDLKAGASIVHSVQDIWGEMSNIFSSPDPGRDLYGSLDFMNSDIFGADISEIGGSDFGDWGSFDGQYMSEAAYA